MLEIKMNTVMIRERDLSQDAKDGKIPKPRHGGGTGMCNTVSTPNSPKTQSFTMCEAVTASCGNLTVCAPDAKSARMALAAKLLTGKMVTNKRAKEILMMTEVSS